MFRVLDGVSAIFSAYLIETDSNHSKSFEISVSLFAMSLCGCRTGSAGVFVALLSRFFVGAQFALPGTLHDSLKVETLCSHWISVANHPGTRGMGCCLC